MLGELQVSISPQDPYMVVAVQAMGSVGGSRIANPRFAPTTMYDYWTHAGPSTWQHVDESLGDTITLSHHPIGYGCYQVTLDYHSIYVDYRDADYLDGTTYPNPDVIIIYDKTNGRFLDQNNNVISGTLTVWGFLGKGSGPSIPLTVCSNTEGCSITVSGSSYVNSFTGSWSENYSVPINATSPQTVNGHSYEFSNWSDNGTQSHSISASLGNFGMVTTANFHEVYLVYFQNSPSGGNVTVAGSSTGSPAGPYVVQPNSSIHAEAISPQDYNGLHCSFSRWMNGQTVVTTSASYDFHPSQNATYMAEFSIIKPLQVTGVFIPSNPGEPIQITWEKHPNSDVVYKIYRRVSGNVEFLGTVNHNDTSYTDDTYTCGGYTNLYYDVRAYHTPSQTYADENWNITAGTINLGKGGGADEPMLASKKITDYFIHNYPNPFNPSTTISFGLVENANVKLDIYDITGRKIASLLDGESSAGLHSVIWNGQDKTRSYVSSGLYFYRFNAIPLSGQRPFIKSGKLLLMK